MSDTGDGQGRHQEGEAAPATVLAGLFLDLWQANLKAFAADQQILPDQGDGGTAGGADDA